MPSPSGTNRERLHLPAAFPRTSPAAAYDAMPGSPPPGYLGRACKWLLANNFSPEDIVEFVCHVDGGGEAAEDETTLERVNNAMEAAAHMSAEEAKRTNERFPGDELRTPASRREAFPANANGSSSRDQKHALDEALANARKIGRGPLGYA
jgi:hypothetical protein